MVALEAWMRARLARQGGGGHEVAVTSARWQPVAGCFNLSYSYLQLMASLAQLRMRWQYLRVWNKAGPERVYSAKRRTKNQLPAGQTAG